MADANTQRPGLSRRAQRTRYALLTAGHQLLADRSVDALVIDDIVQSAGVAKGTFYNHFSDKQQFALTIREDIRLEIESMVSRANEHVDDPVMRVVRGFAVYVGYILASHQRALVISRVNAGLASLSNPMNNGVISDIAAGLKVGRFLVPSVQAGALFVIGACNITLMHALEETNRASTALIAQQLGTLLLRGLGVPLAESETAAASAIYEFVTQSALKT